MTFTHDAMGLNIVARHLGERAVEAVETVDLGALLASRRSDGLDRLALAAALNVLLFQDLLDRVPAGAAYVARQRLAGKSICFDHGALRTIRFADGPTGALPPGHAAFTRILAPLGYELAGIYPLPRLKMTGRAYRHIDAPEMMPQFFVSELHVEEFNQEFGAAARAVFGASRDPLGDVAKAGLARLEAGDILSLNEAHSTLNDLFAAFDRQHPVPTEADYAALLDQSAEAAWIATEGNAFNHATDRVVDVEALAEAERQRGAAIKDKIEVSSSGRVRQTAYQAHPVQRHFIDKAGQMIKRETPGSFYEFISRDVDPDTGRLDLRFDSANATGIFAMTRAA